MQKHRYYIRIDQRRQLSDKIYFLDNLVLVIYYANSWLSWTLCRFAPHQFKRRKWKMYETNMCPLTSFLITSIIIYPHWHTDINLQANNVRKLCNHYEYILIIIITILIAQKFSRLIHQQSIISSITHQRWQFTA